MPRTIVGNIQADGDIDDSTGHEEFSSDRVGQGTYMIAFRQPFRKIPVVQVTPVSSVGDATPEHGLLVASVAGVEKSRVKIVTGFVGGTGAVALRDSAFSFVAIGE